MATDTDTNAGADAARKAVDGRIEQLVEQAAARAMPDCEQTRPVVGLVDAQALASSRGGKRLRALLTLAAHRAAGGGEGTAGRALDLACAIEVFQTAALIHDDIIDDSDMRRGAPSAHKALGAAVGSPAQGDGLGIMLGDLMATLSVDIATQASEGLPRANAIIRAFLAMHRDVEIGQVMDVALETIPLEDADALAASALATYRWKTASYTTIAPLLLGMLCAGVEEGKAREAAWAIGEPLGVAFQINDDLIDVTGDPRATGKPVGGDIKEGKRTLLLADTLALAAPDDRARLAAAYGRGEEARDVTAITRLMGEGAIPLSLNRISDLWGQTEEALEARRALFPDPAAFDALRGQCRAFLPSMGA